MRFANVTDDDLRSILPIHPYTAVVLKEIAAAFASNQRSMFDFIKNDSDPNTRGFKWFIQNHSPMEETPLFRGFHVQQECQQDHVGSVPAEVGHHVGNLRVSPHDDEVGGPVIGAQQVAEEEQDGERPAFLLDADIVKKAQQKSDQVHQKLDNTFRVL